MSSEGETTLADTPKTVDEYVAEQQKEYGTYVAIEPIDYLGARAFNPGDPVPVSHVERGVVPRESVRGVNTKAAQAVTDSKE